MKLLYALCLVTKHIKHIIIITEQNPQRNTQNVYYICSILSQLCPVDYPSILIHQISPLIILWVSSVFIFISFIGVAVCFVQIV